MAWEFEADRPIYQQAAEVVRKRIIRGVYPQGSRLPAVRDLAMEAGVNPNTMQRALILLEDSGIVYSQRTSGRFVSENEELLKLLKYQSARKQVLDFVNRMDELGYGPDELPGLIEQVVRESCTVREEDTVQKESTGGLL